MKPQAIKVVAEVVMVENVQFGPAGLDKVAS